MRDVMEVKRTGQKTPRERSPEDDVSALEMLPCTFITPDVIVHLKNPANKLRHIRLHPGASCCHKT